MGRNVVVCTGHRKIAEDAHKPLIRARIRDALANADLMVFGGASGFDLIALHEAVVWKVFANNPDHAENLAVKYPKMATCELEVIVAATVKHQPDQVQRGFEFYNKWAPGYVNWVEMKMAYNPENLKRRNQEMVNRIPSAEEGYVLAYWTGERRSGTYSCIHYTEQVKKYPVHQIIEGVTMKPIPEEIIP